MALKTESPRGGTPHGPSNVDLLGSDQREDNAGRGNVQFPIIIERLARLIHADDGLRVIAFG
jgi:hypothetical protein